MVLHKYLCKCIAFLAQLGSQPKFHSQQKFEGSLLMAPEAPEVASLEHHCRKPGSRIRDAVISETRGFPSDYSMHHFCSSSWNSTLLRSSTNKCVFINVLSF